MQPILFFDGECGLCQRSVRMLLRLDRRSRLRVAPLGGPTFLERVPEAQRARLPDSLLLLAGDGRLLTRSAAVRESLRVAGGLAGVLGLALRLLPSRLADALYDALAARRARLFARPREACPVPPGPWRERLLP